MLDEQIHEAHLELQKVEQEAKQLEARLRGIPGMERLLPKRTYGTPVDVDAIKGSITARSLINSYDEPLASYLGIQSGSAEAKRLAKAKAQEAAERLMARTEQLREQNAFKREQNYRDALAGYNRLTNRMLGQ